MNEAAAQHNTLTEHPDISAIDAFGLRKNGLSGIEALAQSVSGIAPTVGPTLLIPLVFAFAGNGTWLCFLLATTATVLVALNVSSFAATSSSPGSLYAYATSVFEGPGGQLSAWGLLLAYIGTASAVLGGFVNYTNVLIHSAVGFYLPAVLLTALGLLAAMWTSYRDVKVSARVMLWFEAVSVILILLVITVTLRRTGFHLDKQQFELQGASPSGIRLGLVLALFSFVGFESSTALGDEAKNPLRTVPRAVTLSAVFAGMFFVFCSYSEVLGFREAGQDLGKATAPLHVLADRVNLSFFGPVIDIGAALSFFACVLACVTAGARVTLLMARQNLLPVKLSDVHPRNQTPGKAIAFVGAAAFVGPAILFSRGATGFDVNGMMGSLATYGFIVAYLLVSLATPFHLRSRGELSWRAVLISFLAVVAMIAALAGSLYPWPAPPYSYLVAVFFVYLLGGFVWSLRIGKLTHQEG